MHELMFTRMHLVCGAASAVRAHCEVDHVVLLVWVRGQALSALPMQITFSAHSTETGPGQDI